MAVTPAGPAAAAVAPTAHVLLHRPADLSNRPLTKTFDLEVTRIAIPVTGIWILIVMNVSETIACEETDPMIQTASTVGLARTAVIPIRWTETSATTLIPSVIDGLRKLNQDAT
jgi:hypothetical protein